MRIPRLWRWKTLTIKFTILVGMVILIIFYFSYQSSYEVIFVESLKSYRQDDSEFDSQQNPAPKPASAWNFPRIDSNASNVTILMWTNYYGGQNLVDHIRKDSPVPEWCDVTFDRRQLNNSDAIVFHVVGNDFSRNHLPPRFKNQMWIYFAIESPANVRPTPSEVNGLFNRTMTYRLDSDYPCPYGYISKRDDPLPRNPYYFDPAFPRNKSKLIAWMVSHCSTFSSRENLVAALIKSKRVKVDVYGSCGQLQCDISQELGCYEKLGRTYKFYLSLENSLCKDYITEKFTNSLHAHMVPIVYGSGEYESILPSYPKRGYVHVGNYKNAHSLIEYLLYLDKNETAYAEYFEWKQYYQVHARQGFAGFKKICYELQMSKNHLVHQTYEDMYKWWVDNSRCGHGMVKW